MSRFSDPLSRVRVASPCPADWDKMIGDERVRFCGQCELNVYNLSALTRTQAEDLIGGTERRLCIRYYRRKDGSILTRDCPVGLARLKQRMSRVRRAVAAGLLGFFAGASGSYAVNGFKTVMGEPHMVGVMVEPEAVGRMVEPEPPAALPEVGTYDRYEVTGRLVPVKRRKRR